MGCRCVLGGQIQKVVTDAVDTPGAVVCTLPDESVHELSFTDYSVSQSFDEVGRQWRGILTVKAVQWDTALVEVYMARTAAVNFTGPLQFPYATAATDLFKKEDVQTLAVAVDAHDHSAGKGLPVGALAANVAVPAGGMSVTGGVVILPSNSGSAGHLAINTSRLVNSDIAWYGNVSGEKDMLILNSGGAMIFRSPQSYTVTDMGGTIRMQVGNGGALSCGSNLTVNTNRGANAGGLVMQAGVGGSGNDVQMFSESGGCPALVQQRGGRAGYPDGWR